MQYRENFAWMTNDLVAVFQPGEITKIFDHDGHYLKDEQVVTKDLMESLILPAKAEALFGGLAYRNGFYSFDKDAVVINPPVTSVALAKPQHPPVL